MDRPGIVFLINSMVGGGAERAMANLLSHMRSELTGQDVHLVLLDDEVVVQALPDFVTLHVLDCKGSLPRSCAAVAKLFRTLRPAVCVSFLARANCANVLAARLVGHRAIISERVQTSSHLATARHASLLRLITRVIYPMADTVIAVSTGVADDLRLNFGVPARKLVTIGNPIDAQHLRRAAEEQAPFDLPDHFIAAAGRLVVNKNFSMLIEAYARVRPAAHLVIMGEGPERPKLEAQIARHELDAVVHLLGFVSNPYPVLSRADFFVSSSNAEGFPNTLIEAMSLARPVISTDCPSGPLEILEGSAQSRDPLQTGRHGILVPPNDVDAMAAAMSAMTDPEVRRRYSEKAIQRSGAYGVGAVVAAYRRLLKPDRDERIYHTRDVQQDNI